MKFRKLIATRITSDIRAALQLAEATVPSPNPRQLLVRMLHVGINASDVNFTAGAYLPGVEPPFDVGLEGIGVVERVGTELADQWSPGQAVGVMAFGAFAEYKLLAPKSVLRLPEATPRMLPLLVSGLTAFLALRHVAELRSGETVVVTAAAGGTGHIAVQLAKQAGNYVIGTCSSDEKAAFLKSLGCDRVINYRKESIREVLQAEHPSGVDVVYESVGGDTFQACAENIAVRGRMVVIGMISGYKSQAAWAAGREVVSLPLLLSRSASVRGFFLNHFARHFQTAVTDLAGMVSAGSLRVQCDPTPFVGLGSVVEAVEHMYAGRNEGKVIVSLEAAGSAARL